MPQTQNSTNLAAAINSISDGGSAPTRSSLNLYDWEGTLLRSYSYAEAQALASLPQTSGVTHELLTFQGWNWTLSDIKAWLTAHPHGQLDVGAIYRASDGQDHNYWDNPRLTDTNLISMQKRGSNVSYLSPYDAYVNLRCINFPNGLVGVQSYGFRNTKSLRFISFPNGVLSLPLYAFQGSGIEHISLPNTVTSIGSNSFQSSNIISINLSSLTSGLPGYAFQDCFKLKNVTLPKTITTIGTSAFASCRCLTAINIPSGVSSIQNGAFTDCRSLNDVVIEGTPTLANETFSACPSTLRFYAYRDDLSYFQSATNWSTYYDKFVAIEDYTDYLDSIGIDLQGGTA